MDRSESLFQKQRIKRFVDGKEFPLKVIYKAEEMSAILFAKLMDSSYWNVTRPNKLLYGMAFSDRLSL